MQSRGGELELGEIEVAGVRRSYWLARAPRRAGQAAPPLLIVLHGSGMDGRAMARFTGLADRGPAAGITTVFPNGWNDAWHPARAPGGEPDLDDGRFLAELAHQLEGLGAASSWPVFLAGISQGARYAEHLARHGMLPVTGLFLVAGTALEVSRAHEPVPQLRASVTLIAGTRDRTAPYHGGRLTRRGMHGLVLRRHAARNGEWPGEDIVASAEDVVTDWAGANGITAGPVVEELPTPTPNDLVITRKSWARPGCRPVTLYRIDGGGHGWPGDPQPLPARAIGPIARHLDATGLLLDMALRETASAAGHLALPAAQATPGLGSEAAPPWPAAAAPRTDATAPGEKAAAPGEEAERPEPNGPPWAAAKRPEQNAAQL